MFEGLSLLQFSDKFSTELDCYEYLSAIKWKNGYSCGKCGHQKYFQGRQPCSRCCSRCKYSESVTAHGLFHKIKFPLRKAFYIVFIVVTSKKGVSSHELSRKLELRQKTCWLFKRKVMEAMKSSGKQLMSRKVEVDEFFVGGQEEGKKGRGNEKKKLVVLAIEVDGYGIHRSYAKVIPNAGHVEMEAFFDVHIDKSALIKTDGWKGYTPLKKEYTCLVQEKSLPKGKTFPLMHRHIMMMKAWLRGIHHQCKHLQAYLDEFNYRFNRIKHPKTLFHNMIVRLMEHPLTTYQKIKMA